MQQGGPWDQAERIVAGAVSQLNDYLGHRPVAVLRTQQKIQPYAHEWVRPIPLCIRGAGVAAGRYHDLDPTGAGDPGGHRSDAAAGGHVRSGPAWTSWPSIPAPTTSTTRSTSGPTISSGNGTWASWTIRAAAAASSCSRSRWTPCSSAWPSRGDLPYEEVLFEEAAVLAGTMLMGSGISGNRPDAHDSSVTLVRLVQQIAVYRDAFYERLLAGLSGPHAERLRAEALALRQPLGGARQHFNQHLARRRAEQLQHVNLAQLFARMGYTEAAARQVRVVPVASARMKCDMYCRLTTAQLRIEAGQLLPAAALAGRRSRTCCTAPSSAGRWSIRGTFWASAASTASSPPRRTASTTTASTS